MLIDTHCHLDAAEFDADREQVYAAKVDAGVTLLVVPAVERANFATVSSVCREYSGCFPAYGIHPLYVLRAHEDDLVILREWLQHDECIAVGEIGLDGYVPDRDEALQEHYFTAQLKLAQQLDLPVILHVRRAIDKVLKLLRRHPVRSGIAHAFNGSRQQADAFIKLGFKLGFGGAMTYEGSTRIRELAATLPIDAIVIETDAPDIPPAWKSGGRNTPADLQRIAQTLAALREVSCVEIADATTRNAFEALPRLNDLYNQGETI